MMNAAAMTVPTSSAICGLPPSLVRTKKVPMIDIADADGGDVERQPDQRLPMRPRHRCDRDVEPEHHRADDGADVGLEEVGAHAGHVADVVADVVGDGRGVARVVLGDAGLDLADQVGADVGGLGVDAAADAGEERDGRGAQREAGEHVEDSRDSRPDRRTSPSAEDWPSSMNENSAGQPTTRPRPTTPCPSRQPPVNATMRAPGEAVASRRRSCARWPASPPSCRSSRPARAAAPMTKARPR
jgi:hypothetical protein